MIFKTPIMKEWNKLLKQEQKYLKDNVNKNESKLNQLLAEKVPANLQNTLDTAFMKGFNLIFEKGTSILEKTYSKDELIQNYQINEYTTSIKKNRKTLQKFSKAAKSSSNKNILLSTVSGVGLGVLGIGIPDIVVFIGVLLKSIYEVALQYGFDYQSEEEKLFILKIIQGALSTDTELIRINDELNYFIQYEAFPIDEYVNVNVVDASKYLSKELLYMKFLQGIPIVGAVGGIYDAVYIKKILKYAELKYRRRFYQERIKK
ncbi:MAG: EcsC family protein [Erysipelotrichales bacterium]|nr:EcsC family protein [Erysipelotrichales bacterium]